MTQEVQAKNVHIAAQAIAEVAKDQEWDVIVTHGRYFCGATFSTHKNLQVTAHKLASSLCNSQPLILTFLPPRPKE
jgi:carbamate kinase